MKDAILKARYLATCPIHCLDKCCLLNKEIKDNQYLAFAPGYYQFYLNKEELIDDLTNDVRIHGEAIAEFSQAIIRESINKALEPYKLIDLTFIEIKDYECPNVYVLLEVNN